MSVLIGFSAKDVFQVPCPTDLTTREATSRFLASLRPSGPVVGKDLGDNFSIKGTYNLVRTCEYVWDRLLGVGGNGKVALFKLKHPTQFVPKHIAVKYGARKKNEDEIRVLEHMNNIDRMRQLPACDRVPATVLQGTGDKVFVVVLQVAEGDVFDLVQRTHALDENGAAAFVSRLLAQMECMRSNYGMVMTDLKLANLLYACTASGDIDVMFADYGSFEDEDENCGTWIVQSTFPPPVPSADNEGSCANQPVTLYQLMPLILELLGMHEYSNALSHVPPKAGDRKERVGKRRRTFTWLHSAYNTRITAKMKLFLRYLSFLPPNKNNMRMDIIGSPNQKWFEHKGVSYASTYEDAQKLLNILFDVVS